MQIPFDRLYQRIGPVTESGSYLDLSNPSRFAGKDFGVVLLWPQEYGFLRIEASGQESDPKATPRPFQPGFDAVETLFQSLGRDPADVEEGLQNKGMLSGRLRRNQPLHLAVSIDTDHPEFKKLGTKAVAGQQSGTLTVVVLELDEVGSEENRIDLVLGQSAPSQGQASSGWYSPPPEFPGFVAIDLGNTNSTLVALRAGIDPDAKSDSIQVLPDERYLKVSSSRMTAAQRPVVSVMKFDALLNVARMEAADQTKALALPRAAQWQIGKWVRTDLSLDGIVVGPKRKVARPPGSPKTEVWTIDCDRPDQRIKVPVDNWLPAELFLCRLLQGFRALERCQPKSLAITYPTTYSRRELFQLSDAVVRAFKRSRWEEQPNSTRESIEQVMPLALDEASAAAFYFLHRRVFKPAGGLRRFRYLYPHGYNLLLYDCGGGTTDVALIRAESPTPQQLKVEVLGRAGVRNFGGDDVTIAVYKILKARLALQIAGHGERPRDLPGLKPPKPFPAVEALSRESLEKYFDEQGDLIDLIVPTRFRPGGTNLEEIDRQKRAMALWSWAEKVKDALADPKLAEARGFHATKDILSNSLATPTGDAKRADLIDECKAKVVVKRAEVDALVQARIAESIRLCNNLIQAKLRSRSDLGDAQVHLVCIAGNGCRYPLIQHSLRKELQVPFLEQDADRFLFEEQHLKHAVAKGAVLALASKEAGQLIEVEFDRKLPDKLPFDVGYRDESMNAARLLFGEGMLYSQLQPRSVPPPTRRPAAENEEQSIRNRFVDLVRRWPGEGIRWSPFLTYRFQQPLQGPVEVRYDQDRQDFVVTHEGEEGQLVRDDKDALYLAPVQRGDL